MYHDDLEKSRDKISAKSRKLYHDDLDKSCEDTAARSKKLYHEDLEKNQANTAARSKKNYHKDVKGSRKLKKKTGMYELFDTSTLCEHVSGFLKSGLPKTVCLFTHFRKQT